VSEWRKLAEEVYAEARRLAPDHPMVLLLGAGVGLGPEQFWIERERVQKQVQGTVPDWDFLYGRFLIFTGRAREAAEALKRARQLDPLNGLVAFQLASSYVNTGDIKAAKAELERGLTLAKAPRMSIVGTTLQAALAADDLQPAQTLAATVAAELNGAGAAIYRDLATLAVDKPALRAALQRHWSDPANRGGFNAQGIASLLAYTGDPEQALEILHSIADAHTYSNANVWTFDDAMITHQALWWPLMRDVRRLPGFKDLVRKLGLAGYWRTTGNWGDFCRPLGEDDFECG